MKTIFYVIAICVILNLCHVLLLTGHQLIMTPLTPLRWRNLKNNLIHADLGLHLIQLPI